MRETPRDATVLGFPGGDPDIRVTFLALGLDPQGIGPVDPALRDPLLCLPGDWEACYARETLNARATDLRRFFSWCSDEGRAPLAEHAALGRTVEDYLRAAGGTLGLESFRRTASHLVAFLKGLGVSEIQADHRRRMVIRVSNRAARERQTEKSEQGDKRWLSRAELKRIETAIRNRPDAPLSRVRDLAIFVLMCQFLLRRDEIRNFRLIDWSPSPSGGRLTIRHSKTDQEGRGVAYSRTGWPSPGLAASRIPSCVPACRFSPRCTRVAGCAAPEVGSSHL